MLQGYQRLGRVAGRQQKKRADKREDVTHAWADKDVVFMLLLVTQM
jgi:hypothetical protein